MPKIRARATSAESQGRGKTQFPVCRVSEAVKAENGVPLAGRAACDSLGIKKGGGVLHRKAITSPTNNLNQPYLSQNGQHTAARVSVKPSKMSAQARSDVGSATRTRTLFLKRMKPVILSRNE